MGMPTNCSHGPGICTVHNMCVHCALLKRAVKGLQQTFGDGGACDEGMKQKSCMKVVWGQVSKKDLHAPGNQMSSAMPIF